MLLSSDKIKSLCGGLGVDASGIVPAGEMKNKDKYLEFIKNSLPPDLKYLEKYQDERFDPGILMPGAKAIIVIGRNYYPADEDLDKRAEPYKIAKYAWGRDYHGVLRKKLRKLRAYLREAIPDLVGRICVDTAPFADVYWAWQAGLGWPGKNSLLISRKFGPRLLIGSLIIDRPVDRYDRPHSEHCGTCTACIEACPTGAIIEPYRLNASRCISYWTIESKAKTVPEEIARFQNGWIFGCDICSDVCPFTRFQSATKEPEFKRLKELTRLESGKIAELEPGQFKKLFASGPLDRPGYSGMKKNIGVSL